MRVLECSWMLSTYVCLLMLHSHLMLTCPFKKINIKMRIFHNFFQLLLSCKAGFIRQSNMSFIKLEDTNLSLFFKPLVEKISQNSSFALSDTMPKTCSGWNNLSRSFSSFETDDTLYCDIILCGERPEAFLIKD